MPSVKDGRASKFRTICEVHREIYDILLDANIDSGKIIDLLEEAYDMGKKMNNKLVQYKKGYDEGWWQKNKNFGESLKRRKERD